MALTAIGICWYMIERFTHGGNAVVTGSAVTRNASMIIVGAGKCRGVMAYGAVQRCGNMRRRFAGCGRAIMTGGTVVHDAGVIEHRG